MSLSAHKWKRSRTIKDRKIRTLLAADFHVAYSKLCMSFKLWSNQHAKSQSGSVAFQDLTMQKVRDTLAARFVEKSKPEELNILRNRLERSSITPGATPV